MDKTKYKILLVDDDPVFSETVSEVLLWNRYSVHYVGSGAQAIEKTKTETFHLFILDVGMPGISGLDVLEQLDVPNKPYSALILSGMTNIESARKAMELGAFSYIIKPFNNDDLLLQVAAALENVEQKIIREQNLHHLEQLVDERTKGLIQEHHERSIAEEALRKSEIYYRSLFETSQDCIFVIEKESGRILDVNHAACCHYGYTKDEFLQMKNTDVSAEPEKTNASVQSSLTQIPLRWHRKKDGTVFPVEISAGYFGSDSRTIHTAFIRDITDRVNAEEQIRVQLDELSHMSRVATLGELTASLAHEINQPLAAILSNAQAALRFLSAAQPDLGEVRAALEDIVGDSQRAGKVIKELRTLMKKGDPQREMLDMGEVIEEALILTKSDFLIRNIEVTREIARGLSPVYASRVQMQQVIINLIHNACEAMMTMDEDMRQLVLRVMQNDAARIVVEVTDFGHGFGEGVFEKIFIPFFTTTAKGMGMGLPICKSIIEAHGGTLVARGNPVKGATFSFTLPAYEVKL